MLFAPHPFTLRQLQYLVAVADRKSFRKAALDCHVSQPSLSAQVAQAEQTLGVQIFQRDRLGVVVTAAGQPLIERARALTVAAEDLVESARRLADPLSGTLRLGAIPTIAPYLLPELGPILRKHYPKLRFLWSEEKTGALVDKLGRSELDGAILALEAEIGDLSQVILGKDPFIFAAAKTHPLAKSDRPIHPEDLKEEAVLVLDDGHCFRKQVLTFCSRTGAEEASYRATSLATLVQIAAGEGGITLLPSLALKVENRRHSLHVRPFAPKPPFRTLALVWRRNSALEATLRPVGETLRSAYTDLQAQAG
jgi:LysR family hydrogen peroxide-inducible transcriptional activator